MELRFLMLMPKDAIFNHNISSGAAPIGPKQV